MYFTDDPVADFTRYDAEQEEKFEKLPVCECCGEPIQQEKAVYYNNQWFCEDCESEVWHYVRGNHLERVDEDGC